MYKLDNLHVVALGKRTVALFWYHIWYSRTISNRGVNNFEGLPLNFAGFFIKFLMLPLIFMNF